MKFIAFFTKGLEVIVEKEIKLHFPDVQILESDVKRIIFKTNSDLKEVVKLKTVDDLGLFIDKVNSVEQILDLDFKEAQDIISSFRSVKLESFSLTVGVVGNKLSSEELTSIISQKLQSKYNWNYLDKDHSNFDIRIFVDHQEFYIGIRITSNSIQDRSYRKSSQPGALKAPIAQALVLLTIQENSNLKVVDNFCGSGTILCEALLAGNLVYGGDIDPKSVQITKTNLASINYSTDQKIKQLDARKTNWPDNFFDCAISNLPWDKQIAVESITDLYIQTLKEYLRIVKDNGTICLLVSKPQILVKHIKRLHPKANIKIYPISFLGQSPTIVMFNS